MPLTITLDRRDAFTVADRKAQFDAAESVKALFARMSSVVGRIASLRGQAADSEAKLPATDPLRADLSRFSDRANALRTLVVATKEGGAITGEMRLREDADDIYGSITSTDGAPTSYAVARVGVIDRELTDVEKSFATLTGGDLQTLNERLKAKSLAPLTVADAAPSTDAVADGGRLKTLFSGLVGTRFTTTATATATEAVDR